MRQHLTGALATALVAVGLVLGVPAVAPVGTAAQAASGRCEPGTGVTVVVDFGGLGGGVPIGCDPSGGGKAASQVVPAAGFSVTYVNGQPFVCRIDGKPSADAESCQRTPPADAYWGLFWSDGESGTWTYSSQGIASLKVPEGGSIGLRWQDGGDREQPGAAPTPAPKPEPKPTPTQSPKPSSEPTSRPGAGGGSGGGASPAPESRTSPPAASESPTAGEEAGPGKQDPAAKPAPRKDRKSRADRSSSDKATVSAEPSPSPSDTALADGELTDIEEVSAGDTADGSSALTWFAVLVVLALAAGVVVAARRRRA